MIDREGQNQVTHERLDVYRVAVQFRVVVQEVAARGSIGDQLRRASDSVLLNIAEGVGRRTPGEQAQAFGVARGSAAESSACFDVLLIGEQIAPEQHRRATALARRVIHMLSKLIRRQAG